MKDPTPSRGRVRCKPTYEGLKVRSPLPEGLRVVRCKPTYEGLKGGGGIYPSGAVLRCKPTYEGLKGNFMTGYARRHLSVATYEGLKAEWIRVGGWVSRMLQAYL